MSSSYFQTAKATGSNNPMAALLRDPWVRSVWLFIIYLAMYREQIGDLGGGIVPRPGWPCVPYKSNVLTSDLPTAAEKGQ